MKREEFLFDIHKILAVSIYHAILGSWLEILPNEHKLLCQRHEGNCSQKNDKRAKPVGYRTSTNFILDYRQPFHRNFFF